jgi:hypothetical protein
MLLAARWSVRTKCHMQIEFVCSSLELAWGEGVEGQGLRSLYRPLADSDTMYLLLLFDIQNCLEQQIFSESDL